MTKSEMQLMISELETQVEKLRHENDHLLASIFRNDSGYGMTEFVGSIYSNRFHRPSCEWAELISASNLIRWNSHEEAVQDGRKPCQTCRA